MTTTTQKRGGCFGRSILTVVIVLIVLCAVCGIASYVIIGPSITKVFNAVAAPLTTSNDFMNALIAKDYTKAYGMVHPDQQANFGGSADGMKQLLESKQMEPSSFALTNFQMGGDAIVNGTGSFSGNSKYVYISLRQDGDTWKILGLDVNDNPPTATPVSTP